MAGEVVDGRHEAESEQIEAEKDVLARSDLPFGRGWAGEEPLEGGVDVQVQGRVPMPASATCMIRVSAIPTREGES